MPSRKQKSRKRKYSKQADSFGVIQKLLPPPQEIFLLGAFIKRYAPSLQPFYEEHLSSDTKEALQAIVIAPLDSIKPAIHVTSPICQEPVPSLVDDVVWSLVQRRDRWKYQKDKDGRNVLAQGYSTSPPQDHRHDATGMTFPSIRPGLTQWQANENVTFCKTSKLFQHLHRCVGDDILRMIMLHSRLFVPLDDLSNGNFTLVCGPPLTSGPVSRIQMSRTVLEQTADNKHLRNSKNRRRKRRRQENPDNSNVLHANQTISRYNMFYSDSFTPKVGLHHNHPLNDKTMTPEKLLASMISLYTGNGNKRRKRWRRLRASGGIEICGRILAGAGKCDYPRLIERYCPLPVRVTESSFGKNDENESLKILAHSHTPTDGVVSFVRSVLCQVFPFEFWGSQRNLDLVMDVVRCFVNLRRKEKLSNKRLMYGCRTNDMLWLRGNREPKATLARSDHEATTKLTLLVHRWLFRGFIMPLLRSVFYVTETEFSAKKVLYYRKPIWSAFRSLSLRKLTIKQFRELSQREIASCLASHRMGVSRLRLLPKKTGVRPIAHLSQTHPVTMEDIFRTPKRIKLGFNSTESEKALNDIDNLGSITSSKLDPISITGNHRVSTNTMLTQIFEVMTYESNQREEPFGSGLKGLSDFYPRYRKYICSFKQDLGEGQPLNLIFASVDIEKCYDNINQKRMYDIARRQISHEDYLIQKNNILFGDKIRGGIRRISKKSVGPPDNHGFMRGYQHDFSTNIEWRDEFCNAVLDSRSCDMAPRQELIYLLREHMSGHIVATPGRFGERYFLQTQGISQGSILSMLLCNIYYGSIEDLLLNKENPQSPRVRNAVQGEEMDHDFLARLVDDFIFVSRNHSNVSSFMKRMWIGHPELGVQINRDKTLVSADVSFQVENSRVAQKAIGASTVHGKRSVIFPWCGMLFNTRTGEVSIDYSRFYSGEAKESLTVDFNGSEGRKLEVRMESYVRPRCIPILFDCMINSWNTILANYYMMILFAAAKTADDLQSTDVNPMATVNEDFLLKCIGSLALYSGRQIRSNLQKEASGRRPRLLDDQSLTWMTWKAFHKVFSHIDSLSHFANTKIHSKIKCLDRPHALKSTVAVRTLEEAYQRLKLDQIIALD